MNDKCPYCNPDKDGYVQAFGAFYLNLKDNTLCTGHCKPRDIDYCPKCGRNLHDDKDNHE